MTYDVTSGDILNIGYQYDSGADTITFSGFTQQGQDSTVCLAFCNGSAYSIPLVNFACGIGSPITDKSGRFTGQLIEVVNGEMVRHSQLFPVMVSRSIDIDETTEVSDTTLNLVYQQVIAAYNHILTIEPNIITPAELAQAITDYFNNNPIPSYSVSISGRVITLTGTDGTTSSVTVPDTDLSAYSTTTQMQSAINAAVNSIDVGVTSFNGSTGAVTYTAPVTSVNGSTGAVSLTASDVGAASASITTVETTSTQTATHSGTVTMIDNLLTNGDGQVTAVNTKTVTLPSESLTSVNGQTGAVVLDASDVGALADNTTYVSTVNGNSGAVTVAPVIVNSASGSIASFADGMDGGAVTALTVGIEPVQDLSNGNPSPSNICPITGHSSVVVTRTGKNLLDSSSLRGGNFDTASNFPAANIATNDYMLIKGGQQYTLSQNGYPSASFGRYIRWYDANKTHVKSDSIYTKQAEVVTAPVGAVYAKIMWYSSPSFNSLNDVSLPQFEVGSTETDYEAYRTPASVTIDLDGTRYGGTLDAVSGVLTVTHALIILGSGLSWSYFSGLSYFAATISNMKSGTTSTYCSAFKKSTASSISSVNNYEYNVNSNTLRIKDSDYTSASDFVTAMSSVQFCYELATPLTVQLTAPTLFNVLYGNNNVWADTGDVEIGYHADTKLYIDGISEADQDMIADSNIASGDYFMVNNQLYLATAAISTGTSIVPGTNCTKTDLATALNTINA